MKTLPPPKTRRNLFRACGLGCLKAVAWLFLLGAMSLQANPKVWQGTDEFWQSNSNWEPTDAPTASDDVVIGNLGVSTAKGSVNRFARHLDFQSTRSIFYVRVDNNQNVDMTVTSLSTEVGSGILQFRQQQGSLNVTILEDLTVNSELQIGGNHPNSTNHSLNQFHVNGTTFVNNGGQLTLRLVLNNFNPNEPVGGVDLGNLVMESGGVLDITRSGATPTGTTNTIDVNNVSGTGGNIRAAQSDTTGVLIIQGPDSGNYSGRLHDGSGTLQLVRTGTGTQTLSGDNNTYTGGTTVRGGTLIAGHDSALGSGGVVLTGANEAVLRISGDVTIGNSVTFSNTHGDSRVEREVNNGNAFDTGTSGLFSSGFDGGINTVVQFLGGEASAERTLATGFSTTSTASNDALRISDVLSLTGTGDDVFALQLQAPTMSAEGDNFLGWFNGVSWVNAIDGNSMLGGSAVQGFEGSFVASAAAATADYLGSWGFDVNANTVWAVLDHNSQFAVIPEPGSLILLGSALLVFLTLTPRRRQSGKG